MASAPHTPPALDLDALKAAPHPVAPQLSAAIEGAFQRRLGGTERHWLERIEQARARLEASDEEVAVRDYGAGRPDAPPRPDRSAEEAGVSVRSVGKVCRSASQPARWALVLFRLIRALRPARCIEMGTCLGVSAAYQAAACELNGGGDLVTLEGSEDLARVAASNLEALGLSHRVDIRVGRFQDTLGDVLAEADADFVFIDGHHDEFATRRYYDQVLPHLAPGALLVFDDIRWSDGMRRAWAHIAGDDRNDLAVDLEKFGLCVVGDRTGQAGAMGRLSARVRDLTAAEAALRERAEVAERKVTALRARRAVRFADMAGSVWRRSLRR